VIRDARVGIVGALIVRCNVGGAELRVDGVKVAILPTAEPVRVVAGTHTVEVVAQGYSPARRIVDVAGNGRVQETFALTHVPNAPPEPLTAAASGKNTFALPQRFSMSLSTPTWISGAVLGGFLGAGSAALIVREINVASYNDNSRCVFGAQSREERCGSNRDTANAAEVIALTAFTGAGLAAIVTGLLLANDTLKRHSESGSLQCSTVGWGVGCAGRF
jgi:hypothetical protein